MRRVVVALIAVACGGRGGGETAPPAVADASVPVVHVEQAPDAGPSEKEIQQARGLEDVLNAVRAPLHRCWERAAADDMRLSGGVVLKVTIGEPGKHAVSVVSNATRDAELVDCAVQLFAAANYGPGFKMGDTVELPLDFPPVVAQYTVRAGDLPLLKRVDGGSGRRLITRENTGSTRIELDLVTIARPRADLTIAGENLLVTLPGGDVLQATVPGFTAKARVQRAKKKELPILGGKGGARILFEHRDLSVVDLRLDPAAVVPKHTHDGSDELLYVVQGTGTMTIAGDDYPVETGMAIRIPEKVEHAFVATSAEPVIAVQFYVPGGPEQRFKPQKAGP